MAGTASVSMMAAIKVGQLNKCSSLEEQQEGAREIIDWMDSRELEHYQTFPEFTPVREQLQELLKA